MCFQEHYIYKHGECIADEWVDYYEYFWDESEYETYEEFKKDYEDAPPQEKFDDNGFSRIGGFQDWYDLNWSI